MSGIAKGLLKHVGDVHGADQGSESVGVEACQGADLIEIDRHGFGEHRPDDQLTIFNNAAGLSVFL